MSDSIIAQFLVKTIDGLPIGGVSPDHLHGLRSDLVQIFADEMGLAKQIEDDGGTNHDKRQKQQKHLPLQCRQLSFHVGTLRRCMNFSIVHGLNGWQV